MVRMHYCVFAIVVTFFFLLGCAPKHPMIEAAYDGDMVRVKDLLKEGVGVNLQHGRWNETALYVAARQGHMDMVKALLKEDADVNLLTGSGESPLTGATWQCHSDVARLLISEGADVNYQNQSYGFSPLMFAVECENLKMVNDLIAKGADINAKNKSEISALLCAIRKNNARIAGVLIDAGANIDAVFTGGGSALYEAAQLGHDPVVKMLIGKGADLTFQTTNNRWSPLMAAVAQNHSSTVAFLLDAGPEVDVRDIHGYTPLIMAAYGGNAENVRLLCDKGANVDIQNINGWTALHFAVSYKYKDIVPILLMNKASLDIPDNKGRDALWYAQKYPDKDITNMLKNPDALLTAISEQKATPDDHSTQGSRIEGATIQTVRSAKPLEKSYSNILFNSFEMSKHLVKDYPEVAINCQQATMGHLNQKNVYASISENEDTPYPPKTILIDGVIEDIHLASTVSRVLFGPLAGSPFIDVRISLKDAESNTVIHEKVISSNTNAWFAGITMGTSDKNLSNGMGAIIGEYLYTVIPADP